MNHPTRHRNTRGFTLLEVMIASSALAVSGGIIYSILTAGLTLFAKNSAINVGHQQARMAVLRMERDLHSAISLPQLVDANRVPVAGTGPSAGVAFQLFAGGPFSIHSNQVVGDTKVQVDNPKSYVFKVGQRLIIPTHEIEIDITGISTSGTVATLTLASGISADIVVSSSGTGYNIPCFVTDRAAYVVANGELRRYPTASGTTYQVFSYGIVSPTPFSTPTLTGSSPSNRYVSAINLSASDTTMGKRSFKSMNMFLNSSVPTRATLTEYQ
jgi:prepilin-type N-terminal cleavage/methylation domain-containing protein